MTKLKGIKRSLEFLIDYTVIYDRERERFTTLFQVRGLINASNKVYSNFSLV